MQMSSDCGRAIVGRIEVEYNHIRIPGQDQIFNFIFALGWFNAPRFQIALKQRHRHQLDNIRVPQKQRNIDMCIHGVR